MQNSTKVAVGLVTFGFVTLVLFIVMSTPIETIFSLIEDKSAEMNVTEDVDPIIANLRTVFGLCFVLSMVGLVFWAILASHQEEYEEYPDQYRR